MKETSTQLGRRERVLKERGVPLGCPVLWRVFCRTNRDVPSGPDNLPFPFFSSQQQFCDRGHTWSVN